MPREAHGCRQVQHRLLVPLVWVCGSPQEVHVSTATESTSLLSEETHMMISFITARLRITACRI